MADRYLLALALTACSFEAPSTDAPAVEPLTPSALLSDRHEYAGWQGDVMQAGANRVEDATGRIPRIVDGAGGHHIDQVAGPVRHCSGYGDVVVYGEMTVAIAAHCLLHSYGVTYHGDGVTAWPPQSERPTEWERAVICEHVECLGGE